MKRAGFKSFINTSQTGDGESQWVVFCLVPKQTVNSSQEFSGNDDEGLFWGFALAYFSVIKRLQLFVVFKADINTEIKHKAPFLFLSSTHDVSSFSEASIAWSILSCDSGKEPNSILNKCFRPQGRRATVFLERSKRPQGGNQVVFPPVVEEQERVAGRNNSPRNFLSLHLRRLRNNQLLHLCPHRSLLPKVEKKLPTGSTHQLLKGWCAA